jgi:hypothetical protein
LEVWREAQSEKQVCIRLTEPKKSGPSASDRSETKMFTKLSILQCAMVAFLFYPLSFSYEAVQQGLELTQACIVAERGCVSLASRLMSNIGISKNLLCYSVFDAWHIRHAEVAARGQDEGKTGQLGWRIFLFSFKLAMVSFLFLFTLDLDSLDI